MPMGESANDFSWMYGVGGGQDPNAVGSINDPLPYGGNSAGAGGYNSGADTYFNQGPQAWADWYKSQYPDWSNNVATNQDTGFAVDPSANPFNNPSMVAGRQQDAFATKRGGGSLSDIKGAFGGVTSGNYGYRPDLENPGVAATGGQGKVGTNWLDTWLPRIVMGVMGYGTAAGLFGAGGLLSGEAAAGAGSGVGAGTGTGFGTTGSAVSAFTPAQQAAMMAGADGMGGTGAAAAGSAAGAGSTQAAYNQFMQDLLANGGVQGTAGSSIAPATLNAATGAADTGAGLGDLGWNTAQQMGAQSAASAGGSAASTGLSGIESVLSKIGVLDPAGKFSLGGTIGDLSKVLSVISTMKARQAQLQAAQQNQQNAQGYLNPTAIQAQMQQLLPNFINSIPWQRSQENANVVQQALGNNASASMGRAGWGANSGMNQALQQSAINTGGNLRNEGLRNQAQIDTQTAQALFQALSGINTQRANTALQYPYQLEGGNYNTAGNALALLSLLLGK